MDTKIPATLYRGIVINYDKLQNFKFYGEDLVPYGEPIIDENGRKLIGDGNEFGIYMTDNQSMVYAAYGCVHHGGTRISKDIRIGSLLEPICIPDIGIAYQIKTDGINVRFPWISSTLKGHYNNGFEGHEYITDRIPAENISVTRIQIGSDYLHKEEFINVTDIKKAQELTKRKLEERKSRLKEFLKMLSTLSPQKRRLLGEKEKILFCDIFGENGVKYLNLESIDTSNANNTLTYLLATIYHNDPNNLDMKKLLYIEQLKARLKKEKEPDSINTLLGLVQSDIQTNLERKLEFIERKQQQSEEVNTTGFDFKNLLFTEIQNTIISLRQKKENKDRTKLEEMRKKVLKKIEQLLQIEISPFKGYIVDPNQFHGIPRIDYKTVSELTSEQGEIFQKIDALYIEGTVDLGTSAMMKRVILEEYEKMKKLALEREQKLSEENQNSNSPKAK